jgi:hypothetical protein
MYTSQIRKLNRKRINYSDLQYDDLLYDARSDVGIYQKNVYGTVFSLWIIKNFFTLFFSERKLVSQETAKNGGRGNFVN